jgi:hypothetical protein
MEWGSTYEENVINFYSVYSENMDVSCKSTYIDQRIGLSAKCSLCTIYG